VNQAAAQAVQAGGQNLPADAIVVRYGEMKEEDLTRSVYGEYDDSGRWGVSVLSRPNLTALELIEQKPLKHASFRVSTVGEVSQLGLFVWPDDADPPHALILYPAEPTSEDWDRLRAVFSGNQPNPHAG
jgi:hypothetical protein